MVSQQIEFSMHMQHKSPVAKEGLFLERIVGGGGGRISGKISTVEMRKGINDRFLPFQTILSFCVCRPRMAHHSQMDIVRRRILIDKLALW